MIAKFIDRKTELQYLQDEFNRLQASLVIVYGRRRIGKTTLIKEFIKDKDAVYFLATQEPERENKKSLQRRLADVTGNILLRKDMVLEWSEIFNVYTQHLPERRKVLVIDEFQYLAKGNRAFPSIFQKIWDEQLAQTNVMVILCGSLVSMMVQQTLSYSSPLYGRRTGQIRLKQIPFRYYSAFFDPSDPIDWIEYYAVTGGVPKYIELFRPAATIFDAVKANVLSKQSFLYEEPIFLLEREVGEIGTYFSIIKTIAAGNHKLGNISARLGINQSGVTKYLHTLVELDLVERIVPVTAKNPAKSKKGLYRLKDNFIKFWFKFVYPYRSYLEMDQTDVVIHKLTQNFRDNHVSYVFEDICRESLLVSDHLHLPDFPISRCGSWWDRNVEIDIVALSETQDHILFGECKYTGRKVDVDVYFQLMEKSKRVGLPPGCSVYYLLFSKSGFSNELIDLAAGNARVYLIENIGTLFQC